MAAEPAVQHDHLPIMAIHTAAALASIAGVAPRSKPSAKAPA